MKMMSAKGEWEIGQDWRVVSGEEVLFTLPSSMNEHEVMAVIRSVREIERQATEQASAATREICAAKSEHKEIAMQSHISGLKSENERLAALLEKHIDGNTPTN